MFKWNSNFGLMFSWVWAGGNHSCPVKRQWGHSYYPEISNNRISSIKSLKISLLITWGYLDVCWRGGDLKIGHIYHIYISEGNSILLFYFKYLIDLTKVYDYKCRSPPLQKKKRTSKNHLQKSKTLLTQIRTLKSIWIPITPHLVRISLAQHHPSCRGCQFWHPLRLRCVLNDYMTENVNRHHAYG